MNKPFKLLIATLALALPLSLTAQVKDPASKKPAVYSNPNDLLPLDPAVRSGKLPNGFTYFIRKNTEPKNRVIMYMVNKVGSILENDDQRGLAHFMEHMSFNGTTHFPKNELVNYLQKSGVRFGADLNAYTSFDETVYQLPLPTDDVKLLNNGLQIMRDWAKEALLDTAEIKKEVGVVLEEKRLGKGAGERMQRQFMPLLLNHSRYANRIPIGTDSVLNNFTPETLKKFYTDWYRPNLQALIVVGDIDVTTIEKQIKSLFSDLKNPVNEKPRTKYGVDLNGQNQFIKITDPEMTSTVLNLIIKQKATPIKTKADYRYNLTISLFNQMLSDRFQELARQSNPPFISAGSGISDLISNIKAYSATLSAKPGELENGFKALWRESERVSRYGFTQTELKRAKENQLNFTESAFKEREKTNSSAYADEYTQYFLGNGAAPGIQTEYSLVKDQLPGITLAEVNGLIKKYISNTNRDIIIMAPEQKKDQLPNEATVLAWIDAVKNEQISPYHDDVTNKPLLSQKPTPGKVVSEKQLPAIGVTELKLSNGITVLLKPTAFKNDEITFQGFAPGGTSLYSDADYQSATYASGIIAAGGVGAFNATQLANVLAGKQASVSPYIDELSQNISGYASSKDLETALQLTYLYFTQPRKDSLIFNSTIDRSKASIADRGNDPSAVFADTVNATLGNYNIRRTGPSLEKLAQIDLEKAYSIYRERFADAAGFTFVFVGSFRVEQIKPLLEQYLGALPATNQNEQAKALNIFAPNGHIEKTVYKGTEPKATVCLVFPNDYDYNEQNNKNLDALAETLEIRLLERLREDENGVYSPSAQVNYNKYPKARTNITVTFGCAPQNVDQLIASTLDELDKIRKNGPDLVNLEKYKAEDQRTMETALKSNGFWLNYLYQQLVDQEDLNSISKADQILQKVTAKSVQEIAQKYFDGKNFIQLVLMPEKQVK